MALQQNPYSTTDNPAYDSRGYRTRDEAFDALGPRHEFAATEKDAPYTDEAGNNWAPGTSEAFSAGNDAHRLGRSLVRSMYPSPTETPEAYYAPLDADDKARHAVEYQDADGWTEAKNGSGKRAAPNPESIRPPETRPTMQMAPTTYTFTRPFDQHAERTFNGLHFSMADHRRTYDILGMEPVRSRRNTFRIEPPNWDSNITDMPPEMPPPTGRPIQAVEIPQPFEARSYRLM
jgi:hypothetical protein